VRRCAPASNIEQRATSRNIAQHRAAARNKSAQQECATRTRNKNAQQERTTPATTRNAQLRNLARHIA
jgi:hypothetical protein